MQRRAAIAALLVFTLTACASADPKRRAVVPSGETAVLDDLQRRTFDWFWQTTNPQNGLVPDRWPTITFSSIAAVGFGLNAYAIGAEHGWVTREAAAQRVLTTLQFFVNASRNPDVANATSYKGFYYHFLDMNTGARFKEVELSSIDTTLLLGGALFCQSYFDRDNPTEQAIRDAAETLYRRADWSFFVVRPHLINMGWTPEQGFSEADWHGYNEAMLLEILALGSPTHPVDSSFWTEWTRTYEWNDFYGEQYVTFPSLFAYQYSHVWIDFRGIRDDYMRARGIDYFENSRRATIAQRAYAIANPGGWKDYGPNVWGLTASDGPGNRYEAYGASPQRITDNGTIAPTAAASSIVFTPELSIAAIEEMQRRYGDRLYRKYGFADAFNPTQNWFDVDQLGIDQGPIIAMIENYRSGLLWNTMKKNRHIVEGLKKAGFTGGWLQ